MRRGQSIEGDSDICVVGWRAPIEGLVVGSECGGCDGDGIGVDVLVFERSGYLCLGVVVVDNNRVFLVLLIWIVESSSAEIR